MAGVEPATLRLISDLRLKIEEEFF